MLRNSKCFKVLNKPARKKIRLFFFPYAGGNASICLPFKDKLGDEIELIAVQLPGRSERMFEDVFIDMNTLVEALYKQISPVLNKPFAFLGYSMGGVIAYSLTKKIEAFSQYKPEFIIISASTPIEILNKGKKHQLDDEGLIEILKANNASPKEVLESKELMALILPTVRADYQLIETYHPSEGSLLETELVLFNSEADMEKEKILLWKKYFKNEPKYVNFDGGHFFIHSEVTKMADEIRNLVVS